MRVYQIESDTVRYNCITFYHAFYLRQHLRATVRFAFGTQSDWETVTDTVHTTVSVIQTLQYAYMYKV